MNDKSDSQNELNRVMKKIQEIVEKSADGNYIYRGESEHYEEVSSSLYREHPHIERKHFRRRGAHKMILEEAKVYTDKTDPIEILTELQHFGGKTNLIDFTEDYLIALFFACDGSHDKDGRIILVKKESKHYKLRKPRKTVNRVESQKSIFVEAPDGFVEPDIVVNIPLYLKLPMLDYLRRYHKITAEAIYNDLHGFIKRSAYTEFLKGLNCQDSGDEAKIRKERQGWYEKAIRHYTETVKLKPDFLAAYNNRGNSYNKIGDFEKAIQDFNAAIDLDPEFASFYSNRGLIYNEKGDFEKANSGL